MTIDRIEKNKIVLKSEDGQELICPKKDFSDNYKEGDVVNLELISDAESTFKKKQLVQNLLRQILSP